MNAAASLAAFHTGTGVINGASSALTADGVEGVVSTVVGSTTAGTAGVVGLTGSTCDSLEAVFWDNYALTATERTYLNNNQHAVFGF